ncbi:MAG: GNAT family N-acetyltransferase [Atopobiaceae bacterium]|nr:GNAT family N-acetyltransferase [Atopobiaceae bacterium]
MADTAFENGDEADIRDARARAQRQREKRANLMATERLQDNAAVVVAVGAGVIVSIVKFFAAYLTGSSAMLSEGIHSMVDAINDSLLLVGNRLSKRKPDVEHPFGYGSELYFYSLAVALVIFVLGGGFVIYEGIQNVLAGGHPIENPLVNYVVLVIGIIFEGFSLSVAVRTVNRERGDMRIMKYIRESKSPTNITVFLEDTAAVGGMVVALVGNIASQVTGNYIIDAWASVVIGVIMALIALVLLRETRGLLIGEGLTLEEVNDVVSIVESDPDVIKCGRVLSLYLGPEDLLINLDVTFNDDLAEGGVLMAIDRIEDEVVGEYSQATRIFIEAESLNQVSRQRRDRRRLFEAYEREKFLAEHAGGRRSFDELEEDARRQGAERRARLAQEYRETILLAADSASETEDAPVASVQGDKKLFDEIPGIEGERVVINKVVDADADALRDLAGDPLVRRWLPAYLIELQHDDPHETIRLLYGDIFKNKESLVLAIRRRESGEFVGLAEYYGLRDNLHKVSIGCRLRRCWWGQGIATEATRLMVGYLYAETDIEIATASTMVENVASARVLEKADFIRTARYVEEDWGYPAPTIIDKWVC